MGLGDAQVEKYCRLSQAVQDNHTAQRYDADSLALNAKLLELNPEVYSAWNFRKRCLGALLPTLPPADGVVALEKELQLVRARHCTACARFAVRANLQGKMGYAAMAAERCRGDGAARVHVECRRRRRCARTPSRTAPGTTGAGWCVRASAAWSASWRCARSCWTWTSATSTAGATAGAPHRLLGLVGTPEPTKRARGRLPPHSGPATITHAYAG